MVIFCLPGFGVIQMYVIVNDDDDGIAFIADEKEHVK